MCSSRTGPGDSDEGGQQVKDDELQEALDNLAGYMVDRTPDGWARIAIEIEFVEDDVVKLSGEYTDEAGVTAAMAFDDDVVAIADSIREALDQPGQEQVKGLRLALGAGGVLSGEFTYADAE